MILVTFSFNRVTTQFEAKDFLLLRDNLGRREASCWSLRYQNRGCEEKALAGRSQLLWSRTGGAWKRYSRIQKGMCFVSVCIQKVLCARRNFQNPNLVHEVREAATPVHFRLLQSIGNLPGGIKVVCDMRAHLLVCGFDLNKGFWAVHRQHFVRTRPRWKGINVVIDTYYAHHEVLRRVKHLLEIPVNSSGSKISELELSILRSSTDSCSFGITILRNSLYLMLPLEVFTQKCHICTLSLFLEPTLKLWKRRSVLLYWTYKPFPPRSGTQSACVSPLHRNLLGFSLK